MEIRWAPVMRVEPPAAADVVEALRRAGIPSRVERGNPHTRRMLPHRIYTDPDTIHVPAADLERAREALAAHLEIGDARIRRHLRGLWGELAVAVAGVAATVFVVRWIGFGFASAWPALVVFAVAAPFGWRRLRRGARDRTGGAR